MLLLSAHQMKMAGDTYPGGAITASDEVDQELFGQFSFCDELLSRIYKFLEVVTTTFQQLHIQGTFFRCCGIWQFFNHKVIYFLISLLLTKLR